MRRLGFLPLVLVLAACTSNDQSAPYVFSLERMLQQPRVDPYEGSRVFSDGKAMRDPPAGTVPRERLLDPPELVKGRVHGAFVREIPLDVDRALLERGRDRFQIYCGACHGLAGDGRSPVAESMRLRKPPSLLGERIRRFPPGRIFQIVSEGFGLMPSYADALPVRDRWAVVAYVEVLQISRRSALADLPPELRRRALAALRAHGARSQSGGRS